MGTSATARRSSRCRGWVSRCGRSTRSTSATTRGTASGAVRLPAEDVATIIRGIEERDVLPNCDAVLSGYLGDASLGEVVVGTVGRVKGLNAKAIYCFDPVMGDAGRGFFVRSGIPEFIKEVAVPAADIITPNQFELEFLSGFELEDLDDALEATDEARRLGPETVLTTSLRRRDAVVDTIEMLAVSGEGAWLVQTPMLALEVNGAGDATAALFLAHLLRGAALAEALSMTASAVYAVLEETRRTGSKEMRLVSAQESIVEPPHRFKSRRIRKGVLRT